MKPMIIGILSLSFISISSGVLASDDPGSDVAFKKYAERTFLSTDDSVNFMANVQDVVGQYVFIDNGKVTLLGNRAVDGNNNSTVKLEQRIVFRRFIENKGGFDANIAALFKLEASAQKLYEVTISDLISSGNKDVSVDKCLEKNLQ